MIDAISFLLIIDLSDPNVSLFSTQFSPQLRSKKSIVKIRYSTDFFIYIKKIPATRFAACLLIATSN